MTLLGTAFKILAGSALVSYIVSPQQGADNWSTGVAGAQAKYTKGVQDTQVDVAAKAVAAQGALLANFTNAVSSGLWAQRVMARGTQYWKATTVAKAANYATGGAAGKGNYLNAANQLYPYQAQLQAQVQSLPSGTRSDALQRFTTWMDGMIAFKSQYQK